jgi:hypothetical protein
MFSFLRNSKGIAERIDEGQMVMDVNAHPDVIDDAFIDASKQTGHYGICGYGTASGYTGQLEFMDAAQLLKQPLVEEHDIDDLFPSLAVRDVNQWAEVCSTIGGIHMNHFAFAVRTHRRNPCSGDPVYSHLPREQIGNCRLPYVNPASPR